MNREQNIAETREDEHDLVYGSAFADFRPDEIEATVQNYADRFAANDINPRQIFEGMRCLDAGCGYGRGSLFMLRNGAASVDALDVSPTNIETAGRHLSAFGFNNYNTHLSSIEHLPFEDESFDIVWCYGVIHHAADTDACLRELSRVLKVGGQMKLFIYGSGGVFWYTMRQFREVLASFSSEVLLDTTRLMDLSTIEISNFIDSWKVAYLRCYTHADLGARLEELGFADPQPQPYGLGYDQNHRKTIHKGDADWMGEGDLRYLVTKTSRSQDGGKPLNNSEYGSDIPFSPLVLERFKSRLDTLGAAVKGDPLLAVAAVSQVHRKLFAYLRADGPFEPDAYAQSIDRVIDQIAVIRNAQK